MNLNSVTVTQMSDVKCDARTQSDSICADPDSQGEIQIEDVVNIRESRNCENISSKENFVYPDIILDTLNGVKKIPTGQIKDYTSISPNVEVTLIKDVTESDERHTVEQYSAYGIWEYSWVDDTFGSERSSVVMLLPSEEHGVVNFSPTYRGIMARFTDGSTEYFGNFDRHSATYDHHFDSTTIYTPPVTSNTRTFVVSTEKGVFNNIVNVRRSKDGSFALQQNNSNCVYVSEIFEVKGSLYTICVKYTSDFTNAKYATTAFKRGIGVYKSDGKLYMIGYPETASVYKSPAAYSIELDDIHSMHIKTPSGDILDTIPQYVINNVSDIPDVKGKFVPDEQIRTDMSKDDVRNLLVCRVAGLLEISNDIDSDYKNIIQAYPELESVLKGLTEPKDIYKYHNVLPYDFSRSELVDVVKEAKLLVGSSCSDSLTAKGYAEAIS